MGMMYDAFHTMLENSNVYKVDLVDVTLANKATGLCGREDLVGISKCIWIKVHV